VRALADALSWSRVALAPVVLVALSEGRVGIALGCTSWAIASDVLDGVAARRGRGPTRAGALLDAWADMAFLTAAFAALASLGAVPPLLLALMLASFLPFTLGRSRGAPQSVDPLGKHLGTLLYLLLLVALTVQDSAIVSAGSYAIALVLAFSAGRPLVRVTRTYLAHRRRVRAGALGRRAGHATEADA
jgi:phosphatidylglycerophosphate synthase